MQHIVTLTLNPAIDKSTTIRSLAPDKKLMCSTPQFEPGGGGVNVSRAIKKLGGNSTAMYMAGGYSGKFYTALLKEEEIDQYVVDIEGSTRENMIVVDESSNLQYRFGMPGPVIHPHEWQECLALLERSSGITYIVASGSLPEGIPTDFFARLAAIAHSKGAKLVVDTSGAPLKEAIRQGVFMIKPNLGELSLLHGVEELQEADMIHAAKEVIAAGGCEVMVVSMGASGATLVSRDEVIFCPSPIVKKRSTVGAGDSMVAGMVLSHSRGFNFRNMLRFGIATGTATTMNPGTELCKKADVDKLFAWLQQNG